MRKNYLHCAPKQVVEHLQASNELRKKLKRLWILQCDKPEQKFDKSAVCDLQVLCHGVSDKKNKVETVL